MNFKLILKMFKIGYGFIFWKCCIYNFVRWNKLNNVLMDS